jgi:hypothetical protein
MPGIYVERRVRGSVDEVWRLTQTPEAHQRWDLRFTEIRYLPRNEGEPQRFLYATRWMPGIGVTGTGESVGERVDGDGNASSALKFASGNWWSLIREGSCDERSQEACHRVVIRTISQKIYLSPHFSFERRTLKRPFGLWRMRRTLASERWQWT